MSSTAQRRFYWQRNRITGVYQVRDRFLAGESVASCNYKEQATLVSDALNHLHDHKQVNQVTKHDNTKPTKQPYVDPGSSRGASIPDDYYRESR